MVLGSKAVDLPYDIRDLFVQAGLAHALAASGFQTSLILGVILQLTKRDKKSNAIYSWLFGFNYFFEFNRFSTCGSKSRNYGFCGFSGSGY